MREWARYQQPALILGLSLMLSVSVIGVGLIGEKPSAVDTPVNQIALSTWQETYQAGVKAYRAGNYDQSIALMRQVLAIHPAHSSAHYYLAICLDLLNRQQEAVPHYQIVVKTHQEATVSDYARKRLSALGVSTPVGEVKALFSGASQETLDALNTAKRIGNGIVALKSNQNALMVEATLTNWKTGKKVSGTFILDTGATYTSISREMAEELGLDMSNTDKVHITTANGRIDVPKVTIDQLQIDGVEARQVQATVIEVRPDSSFSGLLGLSFIRQFKMTIDPVANHLVFQAK